jgi:ATP-dependent DNA helicase RecQ
VPTNIKSAQDILERIFGYDSFRGCQSEVIESTLAGLDALVIMPTGGGKSLCYQLPALLLDGVAIVVSPLIALMQDQVQALELLGVRAAYLNSTLSRDAQIDVLCKLREGELDLLYVAPERLLQRDTLNELSAVDVSLIAIDEAHCVSSWGHDFRRDYLELHQLSQHFPNVPRLALTATADGRTREDIIARLGLEKPKIFIEGFDRPNICYTVQAKSDARGQLLKFLKEVSATQGEVAGIVYCLSRKNVEAVAEWLHLQGYKALPYHAGMDGLQRQKNQQRFLKEEGVIIVATIAFGMGIDKPDVRFVAHLDLPKSVEAYYQETGRAGRDGMPAEAWMVYGLADVVRLSRMVEESDASEEHKRVERAKLEALLGWCEVTTCRRHRLLDYFDDQHTDRTNGCGNCDVCLTPPTTWDATEAAQMALSCVFRTGQRFGAGHVIDVLRGQDNDKVARFNHQNLSTFGIGRERSEKQWRSVFRQLVTRGYLRVDHDQFGALCLTEITRPLLKGEQRLQLREETATKKTRRKVTYALELEDEGLMDALRKLRKSLADSAGVPPYVVFHDATLLEMVKTRPNSLPGLLELGGVGQAKLEKYGEAFLACLAEEV